MELRDKNGLTEAEFLEMYKVKSQKYDKSFLTADMVVFDKDGRVLLIKRKGHPCLGKFAFPGGFVNSDESVEEAAVRELMEETGLDNVDISLIGVYSKPGRDPRGWVVTTAFKACLTEPVKAVAGDDAAEALWFEIENCCDKVILVNNNLRIESTDLAFDHAKILKDALRK